MIVYILEQTCLIPCLRNKSHLWRRYNGINMVNFIIYFLIYYYMNLSKKILPYQNQNQINYHKKTKKRNKMMVGGGNIRVIWDRTDDVIEKTDIFFFQEIYILGGSSTVHDVKEILFNNTLSTSNILNIKQNDKLLKITDKNENKTYNSETDLTTNFGGYKDLKKVNRILNKNHKFELLIERSSADTLEHYYKNYHHIIYKKTEDFKGDGGFVKRNLVRKYGNNITELFNKMFYDYEDPFIFDFDNTVNFGIHERIKYKKTQLIKQIMFDIENKKYEDTVDRRYYSAFRIYKNFNIDQENGVNIFICNCPVYCLIILKGKLISSTTYNKSTSQQYIEKDIKKFLQCVLFVYQPINDLNNSKIKKKWVIYLYDLPKRRIIPTIMDPTDFKYKPVKITNSTINNVIGAVAGTVTFGAALIAIPITGGLSAIGLVLLLYGMKDVLNADVDEKETYFMTLLAQYITNITENTKLRHQKWWTVKDWNPDQSITDLNKRLIKIEHKNKELRILSINKDGDAWAAGPKFQKDDIIEEIAVVGGKRTKVKSVNNIVMFLNEFSEKYEKVVDNITFIILRRGKRHEIIQPITRSSLSDPYTLQQIGIKFVGEGRWYGGKHSLKLKTNTEGIFLNALDIQLQQTKQFSDGEIYEFENTFYDYKYHGFNAVKYLYFQKQKHREKLKEFTSTIKDIF